MSGSNEATSRSVVSPTASDKLSRLFLMCIPRSGSTSLLKCLSFIEDVELWFEPYVTAKIALQEYEKHMGKELPTDWSEEHAAEFDKAAKFVQDINKLPLVEGRKYAFSEVKRSIDSITNSKMIVKDMGTPFRGRTQYLPSSDSGFKYVFIIRDPYLAISSYRQASIGAWTKFGQFNKPVEDFDLYTDDRYYRSPGGCYRILHSVWRHVRENLDPEPLVIASEDLMADPSPYLKKICEVGGLEFREGLLEWDASPDVITSWNNPGAMTRLLRNSLSDFHQTAINSSCFVTQKTRKLRPPISSLTEDVKRAASEGLPFYNEMFAHRFQPQDHSY